MFSISVVSFSFAHIGTIAKVVECEVTDGNVTNSTVPLTNDERQRIARASGAAMDQQEWDLTTGYQFFLCDEMSDTIFPAKITKIVGTR